MSLQTTITGTGWTQIGTGPATVQVITDGVPVQVACEASAPGTNQDGLVLQGGVSSPNAMHTFQATEPIWAQVVNAAASALVACQPE